MGLATLPEVKVRRGHPWLLTLALSPPWLVEVPSRASRSLPVLSHCQPCHLVLTCVFVCIFMGRKEKVDKVLLELEVRTDVFKENSFIRHMMTEENFQKPISYRYYTPQQKHNALAFFMLE